MEAPPGGSAPDPGPDPAPAPDGSPPPGDGPPPEAPDAPDAVEPAAETVDTVEAVAVPAATGGHPPPSPLSGGYLLIVIGEPHSAEHRDLILQRVAKGFLSWDSSDCHVDLEKELSTLSSLAPKGEEARSGERLVQYASESLVTEVLVHPQVNTLLQCVRNLLSSFTRHRHILHAGYTFAGTGSWILQDGTFSYADLAELFHEPDVQRVLRAYENSVSVDVHCCAEGPWRDAAASAQPFTRYCKVRVNPPDVLTAGSAAISGFIDYVSDLVQPAALESLLEPSDVVGNIRFSHPTLYVFPGGQGDAALFGINGFNMLVDGGFGRKSCFWDFARHLDRLDAVLLTRLNNANAHGLASLLRRKRNAHVYPQIGHFFCNLQDRKVLTSPDGDKDRDNLLVSLVEEGQEMVLNLRHLQLKPSPCYRDSVVEPVNLYHKVGHGKLDMYVVSPARDSREVKEFLAKWSANDSKLFASHLRKDSKDFQFPLQNMVSICALLVWQPANPQDNITRILFPGSTPQVKIFEGLDKIRHLEYLKHPRCTAKSLSPSPSIVGLSSKTQTKKYTPTVLDKITPGEQQKTYSRTVPTTESSKHHVLKTATIPIAGGAAETKVYRASTTTTVSSVTVASAKVTTKKLEKGLKQETEKTEKSEKEIVSSENKQENGDSVKDEKQKQSDVKIKAKTRQTSHSRERRTIKVQSSEKKDTDKKEKKDEKTSPTTPKKNIEGRVNGVSVRSESATRVQTRSSSKTRRSPSATPAKSAKEANNRKVAEAKVQSTRSASVTRASTTKTVKKEEASENITKSKTVEKPVIRRTKPASPSKSAKVQSSPSKGTQNKSVVAKGERPVLRKSRASENDETSKAIIGKTADKIINEALVLESEKQEEGETKENKVAEETAKEIVIEVSSLDTNVANEEKHDRIEENLSTATQLNSGEEDEKKSEGEARSLEGAEAEADEEDEDEYLVIEKEEPYTEESFQDQVSVESHVPAGLDDRGLSDEDGEDEKLRRDTQESEKVKDIEKPRKKSEAKLTMQLTDKEHAEQILKSSTEECTSLERKFSLKTDATKMVIDDVISPENKDKIVEEVQGIILSATEIVLKKEEKLTPDDEKKEKEDSLEKGKTAEDEDFRVVDGKQTSLELKEESQPDEKMSTTAESGATTAPTLPEDERIPLDDIKEVVEEKHVLEDTKEKDQGMPKVTDAVQEQPPPDRPAHFEIRTSAVSALHRDMIKTPDEVADLPVDEEYDTLVYTKEEETKTQIVPISPVKLVPDVAITEPQEKQSPDAVNEVKKEMEEIEQLKDIQEKLICEENVDGADKIEAAHTGLVITEKTKIVTDDVDVHSKDATTADCVNVKNDTLTATEKSKEDTENTAVTMGLQVLDKEQICVSLEELRILGHQVEDIKPSEIKREDDKYSDIEPSNLREADAGIKPMSISISTLDETSTFIEKNLASADLIHDIAGALSIVTIPEPLESVQEDVYLESSVEEEPVYGQTDAPALPEYVTVTPDSSPEGPKSPSQKRLSASEKADSRKSSIANVDSRKSSIANVESRKPSIATADSRKSSIAQVDSRKSSIAEKDDESDEKPTPVTAKTEQKDTVNEKYSAVKGKEMKEEKLLADAAGGSVAENDKATHITSHKEGTEDLEHVLDGPPGAPVSTKSASIVSNDEDKTGDLINETSQILTENLAVEMDLEVKSSVLDDKSPQEKALVMDQDSRRASTTAVIGVIVPDILEADSQQDSLLEDIRETSAEQNIANLSETSQTVYKEPEGKLTKDAVLQSETIDGSKAISTSKIDQSPLNNLSETLTVSEEVHSEKRKESEFIETETSKAEATSVHITKSVESVETVQLESETTSTVMSESNETSSSAEKRLSVQIDKDLTTIVPSPERRPSDKLDGPFKVDISKEEMITGDFERKSSIASERTLDAQQESSEKTESLAFINTENLDTSPPSKTNSDVDVTEASLKEQNKAIIGTVSLSEDIAEVTNKVTDTFDSVSAQRSFTQAETCIGSKPGPQIESKINSVLDPSIKSLPEDVENLSKRLSISSDKCEEIVTVSTEVDNEKNDDLHTFHQIVLTSENSQDQSSNASDEKMLQTQIISQEAEVEKISLNESLAETIKTTISQTEELGIEIKSAASHISESSTVITQLTEETESQKEHTSHNIELSSNDEVSVLNVPDSVDEKNGGARKVEATKDEDEVLAPIISLPEQDTVALTEDQLRSESPNAQKSPTAPVTVKITPPASPDKPTPTTTEKSASTQISPLASPEKTFVATALSPAGGASPKVTPPASPDKVTSGVTPTEASPKVTPSASPSKNTDDKSLRAESPKTSAPASPDRSSLISPPTSDKTSEITAPEETVRTASSASFDKPEVPEVAYPTVSSPVPPGKDESVISAKVESPEITPQASPEKHSSPIPTSEGSPKITSPASSDKLTSTFSVPASDIALESPERIISAATAMTVSPKITPPLSPILREVVPETITSANTISCKTVEELKETAKISATVTSVSESLTSSPTHTTAQTISPVSVSPEPLDSKRASIERTEAPHLESALLGKAANTQSEETHMITETHSKKEVSVLKVSEGSLSGSLDKTTLVEAHHSDVQSSSLKEKQESFDEKEPAESNKLRKEAEDSEKASEGKETTDNFGQVEILAPEMSLTTETCNLEEKGQVVTTDVSSQDEERRSGATTPSILVTGCKTLARQSQPSESDSELPEDDLQRRSDDVFETSATQSSGEDNASSKNVLTGLETLATEIQSTLVGSKQLIEAEADHVKLPQEELIAIKKGSLDLTRQFLESETKYHTDETISEVQKSQDKTGKEESSVALQGGVAAAASISSVFVGVEKAEAATSPMTPQEPSGKTEIHGQSALFEKSNETFSKSLSNDSPFADCTTTATSMPSATKLETENDEPEFTLVSKSVHEEYVNVPANEDGECKKLAATTTVSTFTAKDVSDSPKHGDITKTVTTVTKMTTDKDGSDAMETTTTEEVQSEGKVTSVSTKTEMSPLHKRSSPDPEEKNAEDLSDGSQNIVQSLDQKSFYTENVGDPARILLESAVVNVVGGVTSVSKNVTTGFEDAMSAGLSVLSSVIGVRKDSLEATRSCTPASDIDIEPSTPHSDISSGQASRAPTYISESDYHQESDDDVPGSPTSLTSQVTHSPPPHFDFQIGESHKGGASGSRDDHCVLETKTSTQIRRQTIAAPMTTSLFGAMSSDQVDESVEQHKNIEDDPMTSSMYIASDDTVMSQSGTSNIMTASIIGDLSTSNVLEFDQAVEEHRAARGSDLTKSTENVLSVLDSGFSDGSSSLSKQQETGQSSNPILEKTQASLTDVAKPPQDTSAGDKSKDPIAGWGEPLGLPSPVHPPTNSAEDSVSSPKGTPQKDRLGSRKPIVDNKKRPESPRRGNKASKSNAIYIDLTYVPHHGNSYYTSLEFFKRVRARYYVFSGIEPSREVYNALLEAKQTWEDKDLEVTIIPTYDTDTLGYWVAENEDALAKYKIDLSPSASRCTINLQDHETSCSAYRLEF